MGPRRLPRRVSGPPNERRPARSHAAADPRRSRRVRAHADCRAHAPGTVGQAARWPAAALDISTLRLSPGPGPAARPSGVMTDPAEAAIVGKLFALYRAPGPS